MCGSGTAAPATFVPVDVDWSGEQIPLEPVDVVMVRRGRRSHTILFDTAVTPCRREGPRRT